MSVKDTIEQGGDHDDVLENAIRDPIAHIDVKGVISEISDEGLSLFYALN